MTLLSGALLENRFRIDRLLAEGGMSAVYHAFDDNLQIEVAIKENFFTTAQAIEQFKKEALILARLRHPGLPRVLQHFAHEGRQYLVMEFIPGANLWERVTEHGGPFDEATAVDWVCKVGEAVAYLHSQKPPIIHRDIKPDNIKAMPNGQVVLVDFGISKEVSATAKTATGARGVTPGYSPPEQYSGEGTRPSSDIYALGATLYALLTGSKPPDSVSLAIGAVEYVPPDQINPDVRPAIAAAIRWAMQPKPVDRPQSIEDWLNALQKALKVPTEPVSKQVPVKTVGRRKVGSDMTRVRTSKEEREMKANAAPPEKSKLAPAKLYCPRCGAVNQKDSRTCIACGCPIGAQCPQCHAVNRPGVKFCEECGGPLEVRDKKTDVICPRCGKSNRDGISFCEECGASLRNPQKEGVICKRCGAINRPGIQFCEECGKVL